MKTATISIEAYNALRWAAGEFIEGLDEEAFDAEDIERLYSAISEQPIFK